MNTGDEVYPVGPDIFGSNRFQDVIGIIQHVEVPSDNGIMEGLPTLVVVAFGATKSAFTLGNLASPQPAINAFEARLAAIVDPPLPVHHVRGKPIPPEGVPYGTTHDLDCPGCIDIPFTASPRSETYWSS